MGGPGDRQHPRRPCGVPGPRRRSGAASTSPPARSGTGSPARPRRACAGSTNCSRRGGTPGRAPMGVFRSWLPGRAAERSGGCRAGAGTAVTAARASRAARTAVRSLAMASIAANMAGDRASSGRLLERGCGSPPTAWMTCGSDAVLHQARALDGLLEAILPPSRSAAGRRRAARAARRGPVQPGDDAAEPGLGRADDRRPCARPSRGSPKPCGSPASSTTGSRSSTCSAAGLLRGGVTRAAAGRAAVRSDGEPPRRSRGDHQRGNGSGTGRNRPRR